jgi:hypothetical protein
VGVKRPLNAQSYRAAIDQLVDVIAKEPIDLLVSEPDFSLSIGADVEAAFERRHPNVYGAYVNAFRHKR